MGERGKKLLWSLLTASTFLIWYVLPNRTSPLREAVNVQFGFEHYIPFIPAAVIFYLAFFPYVLSLWRIKNYGQYLNLMRAIAVLGAISGIIYLIFPSTMPRPPAPSGDIFGLALGLFQTADLPYNLFPSLHVSFAILTALVKIYLAPRTRLWNWVAAGLIVLSTLLVKQHAVVDVVGGAIVAMLAFRYFIICEDRRQKSES